MSRKPLADYVTDFFTNYLSNERGVSNNTMRSYGNCFGQFFEYMDQTNHIKSDNIKIADVCKENIVGFLNWLQDKHSISDSTRNQRLAVFHSFARYMLYEDVANMKQWQDICKIPIKKAAKKSLNFLSAEGVKFLLSQINADTPQGKRDLVLLSILYDSAARVQELVDLSPSDLHLKAPCYIRLFGKGQKSRIVPIQERPAALLRQYVETHSREFDTYGRCPLFTNNRGGKLTTAGVAYILSCYVKIAHSKAPELIPERLSPHCLRHSKAMHLLQSGVELIYIRDILGHSSSKTTEIYARADGKRKREAIENVYTDTIPPVEDNAPIWERDSKLKDWVKSLGKG